MARHADEKSKIIQLLSENPSISAVCQKVGLSRMTFYRWYDSNLGFREKVDSALTYGRTLWIEIARLGLMKKVKQGDIGAIKYFLSNNDPQYAPKRASAPLASPSEEDKEQENLRKGYEHKPTKFLNPEEAAKIRQTMKNMGYFNEDGSLSEKFIKDFPQLTAQMLHEDQKWEREHGKHLK